MIERRFIFDGLSIVVIFFLDEDGYCYAALGRIVVPILHVRGVGVDVVPCIGG